MKKTNKLRLIPALVLVFAMLLGMAAFAANDASARQADLDYLYESLKENHPNLFANTPEADFLARKALIETRLADESDFDFALDLSSMAALAKDSHTSVSLGKSVGETHYWLFDMDRSGDTWYLTLASRENEALLGCEVTALNGMPINDVIKAYAQFISADNFVKLRRTYWQMCYVAEPYFYLGLAKQGEPLTVTVTAKDGSSKQISAPMMTPEEMKAADCAMFMDLTVAQPETFCDRSKYYFGKALNDSTYYIQYNACAQDPELPMETFAQQTEEALKAGKYSVILLDLRYNGGGSDGVISPILQVLMNERDRGVTVAGLIGESTFSSAIINSVELQEMGFPLIGEPTSGSVSHFGAVNSWKLENTGLTANASSKFISMAGYFDAGAGKGVESLAPDVTIYQTMEDTLKGRDTVIEAILADTSILKPAARADAPLTRGRFVGQLYELTSDDERNLEAKPFDDMFGFEWFLYAVDWAKENNIALGAGDGCFYAARGITWQEAAVLAVRTADALGVTPKTVRTGAAPETLTAAAWSREAVTKAWQWGILPEGADFAKTPTRGQGSAIAAAIK